MSKQKKKYFISILVGLILFILSVTGSLIAVWFQQDILSNAFTWPRLVLIFFITIIGIIFTATLGSRSDDKQLDTKTKAYQNRFSGLRFIGTRLKTRGKGIQVEDVSAIGSDIDIDTTK